MVAPETEGVVVDRIDLNVPFADKNQAKAAGAKWDALYRTWYYPGAVLPDALMLWHIPGSRPDSEIKRDVDKRVAELVADLPAAYERKIAIAGLMALIRAEKIATTKYGPLVIPTLKVAGKEACIAFATAWLIGDIYGEHATLPASGIATLDDFFMMVLPKTRRPADALDRAKRLDSGRIMVNGMIQLVISSHPEMTT